MDWTTIVVAILGSGGLTWIVRGWVERWRSVQEALHQERRERYAQILNPYVQLFASLSLPPVTQKKRQEEIEEVITSAEYRKEVFDLALVAEDEVVRAYNRMMSVFRKLEGEDASSRTVQALSAFGDLLVEIRKSVGNKRTDLNEVDMLQAIGIEDAEQLLTGKGEEELADLLGGNEEGSLSP